MDRGTYDARAYWDRRLDRTWSLRGVGLRGSSAAYNRWLYRVRHRTFHRVVRSLGIDTVGARVMDIGPGVGFYVQRWLRLGADVTGVDIADSAVRRLEERFPEASFVRRDITEPHPELPGGFDVVGAFDVLFHVVDDERYAQAMANVAGLLRAGGWFVFTESCARTRAQPMPHYVRRTFAETEAAVVAAGLEIVERRPAFVLMLTPFDAGPRVRRAWGRLGGAMRDERGGALLGAALYGPELALTRALRTSPTTELLVCRKPTTRG